MTGLYIAKFSCFFILFKYNIGMESAHIFTVWKIVSVWKMPDHCFLKTTSVLFFPLFLYLSYFFDHIPYVFYIPPYVSHLFFFSVLQPGYFLPTSFLFFSASSVVSSMFLFQKLHILVLVSS